MRKLGVAYRGPFFPHLLSGSSALARVLFVYRNPTITAPLPFTYLHLPSAQASLPTFWYIVGADLPSQQAFGLATIWVRQGYVSTTVLYVRLST